MAFIPLKDQVTHTTAGGHDEWGYPQPGTSTVKRCRIDEGTELIRNQQGEEVVSNTHIILDRAQAVSYDDQFTWTDAGGVTRTASPIRIRYIKDLTKVLFTVVDV